MRNFFLLKSVSSIVPIRIFSLKICGIIITLIRWWEKYLSERSLVKKTCLWCDKLIILTTRNRQTKIFLNIKICNRRKITLPKASDSSFSNCQCSSSFKFFYVVLSILNTINLNLSGCFLLSLKTWLKKCKYTEKRVYKVLKYTTVS